MKETMKNISPVFTGLLAAVLFAAAAFSADARTLDIDWDVSVYGAGASGKSLPFWAVTNKNGMFPDCRGGLMTARTGLEYSMKSGIDLLAGVKLSGTAVPSSLTGIPVAPLLVTDKDNPYFSRRQVQGMVNELYFGIRWKMLRLDIGIRDREQKYGGLSLSGGDITWSGNARSLPGYNLQVDWFSIPGTKGIVSLKANYADFRTIDDRYVKGALVHNKSLYLKLRPFRRFSFGAGLEHWALWGGNSRTLGRQPDSFKDYFRVILGLSGGDDATESDRINVLGDQRGREIAFFEWEADRFTVSFAHDIPFEDASGMRFQNFPDGINTLHFSFRDKDRWVSDLLYEFVYTKCQSGSRHDRPATEEELEKNPDKPVIILGGIDDYFNNGCYKSGWTFFGKMAGLPLITPSPVDENGLVPGVCNNRITAHHIGIGGKIARKVPYRLKATYSKNFGRYRQSETLFESAPEQFSLALEVDFPRFSAKIPLAFSVGLYGDAGDLYGDNFGLTLRLSYSGHWIGNRVK